ncbi:tyrosine-type recombinase/integrase [Candidatus Woesearchaeota archaeon]|nr:tyrosine-type recombinase/integrase [Candidatus Woesearchaeota archaeon]
MKLKKTGKDYWYSPIGKIKMRKGKKKNTFYIIVKDPYKDRFVEKVAEGATTKEEAFEYLKDYYDEIYECEPVKNESGFQAKFLSRKKNIKEFLIPFLAMGQRSSETNHQYSNRLLMISDFFDNKPIAKITRTDIQKLIQHKLNQGCTESAVKYIVHVLKSFMNQAKKSGIIREVPEFPTVKLNGTGHKDRPLTKSEKPIFLKHCEPEWFEDIVLFAIQTGFRINNILDLEWSEINFKTNEVSVPPKKNKNRKKHTLQMTDSVRKMLQKRQKEKLNKKYVFCDEKGSQLTYGQVKYRHEVARKKAGFPDLRIHDLRHTFGYDLANSGAGIREIKNMMCHSSLEMTMRYVKRNKDIEKTVLEGINFEYN